MSWNSELHNKETRPAEASPSGGNVGIVKVAELDLNQTISSAGSVVSPRTFGSLKGHKTSPKLEANFIASTM